MTKQTKLELVQINARLAAENAELRTQLADAQHMLAMQHTPTQRVARHMPQWQLDRAAAMAAAKAMAMQTRMSVKV